MKTIIFIPGLAGGGAERQCVLFFNEYSKLNSDSILIFFYKGKYFDLIENNNYHVLQNNGFRSHLNYITFKRYVKKNKPELIISFLPVSDIYCGLLKLQNFKFSWVPFERNSFYESNLQNFFRKFLIKFFSNSLLLNSEKGISYWKSMGYNKKTLFVRNLVYFRKPKEINNEGNFIIFVGRLENQKNIKKTVQVFKTLSTKYNFKCKIIGDGHYYNWVYNEVKDHDKIHLIKFQKNISKYYLEAKALVSISHYEGTPNVVIENGFLGNKIIASNIKEHIDILGENYPFFVDKDLKPEILAKAIVDLLNKKIELSDFDYFFELFCKETAKQTIERVNKFINEDSH